MAETTSAPSLRELSEAVPQCEWRASGRYIGTANHMSLIGECRDENGNWSDTKISKAKAAFVARLASDYFAKRLVDSTAPAGGDQLGAWMQTFSLPFFRPLDPRPEDVQIEDIAHHLSQAVRYGGAGIRWYSVAEHSVHLARAAAPEHALWALLHDASEAYLHDVVRPVKRTLAGYAAAEDRLMLAICERFGLPPTMPPEVKALDNRIVLDERAQNMRSSDVVWTHGGETEPLGITLQFWTPEQAEREFLALYSELTGHAVETPPPTTLTEAVAAARAEGVREGLERAADICRLWDGPEIVPAVKAVLSDVELDITRRTAGGIADAICALITALPAPARAESWQPIEAAPHGRPILIGRWTKPKAGPPVWDAQVFVIESPHWREDFDWIDDEPTHWCEMVAPPTTPGGRTDG